MQTIMHHRVCRPTEDGRNSCCIAIGTDHLGVALLSLAFHQHGPKGIKSQAVRLLPHTASVLSMCVAWDYTPAVCHFPASSSGAEATSPEEESADGATAGQGAAVQNGLAGEEASGQHGFGLQGTPGKQSSKASASTFLLLYTLLQSCRMKPIIDCQVQYLNPPPNPPL